MTARTAAAQTGRALAESVRHARRSWSRGGSLLIALAVAGALLPPLLGDELQTQRLAQGLYLALAAAGLAFTVGLPGMPSLAQGAFMAVGAFGAALVRTKAGLDPLAATLIGCSAAALVGVPAGLTVVRLRPVFVALATWLLAWLVALLLLSFPSLSGGAEGLSVPRGSLLGLELTPAVHYEIALVLIVLAVLALATIRRGAPGLRLSALRQRRAAAVALGVHPGPVRIGAFVASAAIGGLAGALTVQLVGVADASDYGPFLSFKLFVAVLLGGATAALGGPVGVGILALVTLTAHGLGSVAGVETERFDPMLAAVLLLTVIALGGHGLVPALRRTRLGVLWNRRPQAATPATASAQAGPPGRSALLRAEGLTKRFESVIAAEDVELELVPGTVTALIGPNGSGKTTVLRILSGALEPDAGRVDLDGLEITRRPSWEPPALGVVRTLQRTAVFPELTALENVLVGSSLHRRFGGALRTLLSTPKSRAEAAAASEAALASLGEVGLESSAGLPAQELSSSDRRMLMLATALATSPRVLLVDEAAAGAAIADVARLEGVFERLRHRGLAVLVVEHNLRLVRTIADRVIVLAAGRLIAAGTPDEVVRDPAVRDAYLGRHRL